MNDKIMQVLAREPADKFKKENIVHLVMKTDGVKHARCSPNEKYPREGIERRDYCWLVREYNPGSDRLCARCKVKRDALIMPLLPAPLAPQKVKAVQLGCKLEAWLDTGRIE